MDSKTWIKVKTIFCEAIDLEGKEREDFLNKNCADPEIRNEIHSLLSSYDKSEKFLETQNIHVESVTDNESIFIGKFFGKYKVEKLIARGGMGLVYLGLRDDEVKQKAAIKIINPGASSDIIIKRFQTERQTLANLNHPNISRLLDGGITDDGIQFLIMEYIEGIPVTEYCDKHKLNIRDRLNLFLKVASAVQYAHQNLIVHRDLKPGNILITEDGEPKLLDFGIAKILDPESQESEALTNGLWNLTPEYASPEQIKGEIITTSSDVYSLGIILYKLLTGHSPYSIKSFLHSEINKIITQTEPAKASEIIFRSLEKKSGEEIINITPESVSGTREGNIEKLHKKLAGDLDNIISMAIRKEPARRYSSIELFSEDIKRYLNDQPVAAHKDSLRYRTTKFIKRNKAGVISAAVILLIIISGVGGIIWQSNLTAKERDIAKLEADKANRIKSFLLNMISAPDPMQSGKEIKMIDVIQKAAGNLSTELAQQPQLEAEIRTIIGTTYQNLGIYDSALAEMNKALEIDKKLFGEKSKEAAVSLKNLGLVYHYDGDFEKAEFYYDKALEILKSVEDEPSFETAQVLDLLGTLMNDSGNYQRAEEFSINALLIAEALRGSDDYDVAIMKNNLATVFNYQNKLDEADSLYKESLQVFKKKFGNNHLMVARVLNNLAFINIYKKDDENALPLLEEALNIKKTVLGENHPDLILAYSNLGSTYFKVNQFDKAEEIIKASVDVALKNFDENNINTSRAYMWYGRALEANEKADEGIYYLKKAYEIRKNEFGTENKLTLTTQYLYGKCLLNAEKFAEAEKHLLQSYTGLNKLLGNDDESTRDALASVVELYNKVGSIKKADQFSQLLSE